MSRIAIFGYNRLSAEVLKRLDTGLHTIFVIEQEVTRYNASVEQGFTTLAIDFRDDDDLKSIGIGKDIDQLFCFLPRDSDNVFLTLSARALAPQLTIISVIEDPDCSDKLIAAGANKVIDPYQSCGQKFYDLIKRPEITSLIDQTVFGRSDLHIAEITIPEQSPLINRLASELNLNVDYNLILLGVLDKDYGNEFLFIISEQEYRLDIGDVLVILGPSRAIRSFKKEISHV